MLPKDFLRNFTFSRWITIDNPDNLDSAQFMSLWDKSDILLKGSATRSAPLPGQNALFVSLTLNEFINDANSIVSIINSNLAKLPFKKSATVTFSYLSAKFLLSIPGYNRNLYLFVAVFDPTKLEDRK
jgi:hypothetical protein